MTIQKKVSETTWSQIGYGLLAFAAVVFVAGIFGLLFAQIAAEKAAVETCLEQGLVAVEAVKGFLCVEGVKP